MLRSTGRSVWLKIQAIFVEMELNIFHWKFVSTENIHTFVRSSLEGGPGDPHDYYRNPIVSDNHCGLFRSTPPPPTAESRPALDRRVAEATRCRSSLEPTRVRLQRLSGRSQWRTRIAGAIFGPPPGVASARRVAGQPDAAEFSSRNGCVKNRSTRRCRRLAS